jgi:hypothetical protein
MAAVNSHRQIEHLGIVAASTLVPAHSLQGEDAEDTRLLAAMAVNASDYIASFAWCKGIQESWFAGGIGGIFAIFLIRIRSGRSDVDPWIWVMTGDVPSAYLPIRDCSSAAEAFAIYLCGMRRWVALARLGKTGSPEEGVPPINVPATPEWAEVLDKRLFTIEALVGPHFHTDGQATETIH